MCCVSRTFGIPADVVTEAITAQLDSGLLLVTLPKQVKPDGPEAFEVEIQEGNASAPAAGNGASGAA